MQTFKEFINATYTPVNEVSDRHVRGRIRKLLKMILGGRQTPNEQDVEALLVLIKRLTRKG